MEPIKEPGKVAGHLPGYLERGEQNSDSLRAHETETSVKQTMEEQAKKTFTAQETPQVVQQVQAKSVRLSQSSLEHPSTQKAQEVSFAELHMTSLQKPVDNESIKNELRKNMKEFVEMLRRDKEGSYYSKKLFGEEDPNEIIRLFSNKEDTYIATFEKFITEMHCEWSKAKNEMDTSEMKQMQFIRAVIFWSAIDAIKQQCPQFSENGEFYFEIAMSGSAHITSDIDFSVKFKDQFRNNPLELGGRRLQVTFIDEFNKQIEDFFGIMNKERVFTSAITLDINGYAQFYFPHAMTMKGAKRQDIQQLAGSLLMLKNNAPDISKIVNTKIFNEQQTDQTYLKIKLNEDFNKLNKKYKLSYCIFFMREFLIRNSEDTQLIDEKMAANNYEDAFHIALKFCKITEGFNENWITGNKLNIKNIKETMKVGEEFFIKIRQNACSYYNNILHDKVIESGSKVNAIALFREKVENSEKNPVDMTEKQLNERKRLLTYIYKQELLKALTEEVSSQGYELFSLMHPNPDTPEYQQKMQYPEKHQQNILEKQLEILNLNIEIEEYYLEQEKLLQEEQAQALIDIDPEYNIQKWKQLNEEADNALLETSVSAILSEAFAEECHIGEGAFRAVVEGSQENAKKLLSPIQYLQAEIETIAFARLHAEKYDTPFFKLIEMSKYMLRNTEYNKKTEFSISVFFGTPTETYAPKEYRDNIFIKDMKKLFGLRKLSKKEKEKIEEIEANKAKSEGEKPTFSILASNVAMDVGNQLQAYQTVGFVNSIVDSFNMCERPILLI